MADTTILTPALRARLEAVARRVRWLRIARGLGLVTLALLLSAAAAMLVDYFSLLPALVRLTLFAGWLILGAATLVAGLVIPLRRRLKLSDLAAAVEKQYPELAERLTTAVELAGTEDELHGSPAFIALLVSDTAQRTATMDFLPAINARGALVVGTAALAVCFLALAPALVWSNEYGLLSQRFFLAWNSPDLSGPKKAGAYELEVATQDIVAARGRPVTFRALVRPRYDQATLPTRSTLVLIDDNGQETRVPMALDQNLFSAPSERGKEFTLDHPVMRNGRYRIEAGEAVSPTYTIQTIVPVELAANSPAVTITAPNYARETIVEQHQSGIVSVSALEHSEVRFDLCFTRAATAAFVDWTVTGTKEAKTLPLTLSADRCSASIVLPALASGTYRFVLEAEHGIRTELEAQTLTVWADQRPEVVRFEGKDTLETILPYERLPLAFTARDDVGVARADLEYRVNDETMRSELLPLSGVNRQEATARYVWQLAGIVKEADEISYRIRIQDNRPQEYGGPQSAYYPAERWLKVKVVKQAVPFREQEIIAERDDIRKRLEAIQAELQKEQLGINKVRQEAQSRPMLSPEQTTDLKQAQQENRSIENAVRDLAQVAEANPLLKHLAQQARNLAERPLRRSAAALQEAMDSKEPSQRDNDLQNADKALTEALQKLDELKKENDKQAQERLDQQKVEQLADRQKQLAQRAAELAAKDLDRDPLGKQELEEVKRDQAAVAEELQRLSEESEALRLALDQARAEEAKQLSEQAKKIAMAQRDLTKAMNEPGNPERDKELAGKQQDLEKQASQLGQELNKLDRELTRSPEAAKAAEQAANSAEQAQKAMRQASEQQDNRSAAQQAEQNAIQALERAAEQAAQASKQLAQQSGDKPPTGQETGQSVQQAQAQMRQATDKLNHSQPQAAQAAMRQAAQSLQQAAQQMTARQTGSPGNTARPSEAGGQLDPSILGPDAEKYAGKSWGELPGELQTKIVQDLKAKYGEDYGRMIKLYFEQIASTPPPASRPLSPASAPPMK